MEVVTTIAEARARLDRVRATGSTVGLVPTMGALHAGHRSLLERSVADRDTTLMTVFVNPLQFAEGEDLADYPRDLDADVAVAGAVGVDLVLAPSVEEMYPQPVLTQVSVPPLAARLEGASRPTHFAGVATVVAKLFNIAGPCSAYFGEKDYQQLAIVRRMARDLSFRVDVVGCPIVREPDGLALSSRNVYLRAEERAAAPVLQRALKLGRASIEAGETSSASVIAAMAAEVATEPIPEIDYIAVVDPDSLEPVDVVTGEVRLLIAARVGRPRLIDNVSAGVRLAS